MLRFTPVETAAAALDGRGPSGPGRNTVDFWLPRVRNQGTEKTALLRCRNLVQIRTMIYGNAPVSTDRKSATAQLGQRRANSAEKGLCEITRSYIIYKSTVSRLAV